MSTINSEQNTLGRKEWLKNIPETIRIAEEKWQIKVAEPFDLSYNYVAPSRYKDGEKVVLKIGMYGDKEFLIEIEALKMYDGDGVVKLIEYDIDNTMMLIEMVEPGQPLSSLMDDVKATRILGAVIKKIDKPIIDNRKFPHVGSLMQGFGRFKQRYQGLNMPLPLDLIEKAEKLSEYLLSSIGKEFLVHGDLHHDNVLKSTNGQWLVIDPKGVIAEPAYECAAMLRNPHSHILQFKDLSEILKTRILILSEGLDIDPQRILDWGIVQTVLSAIWTEEDHGIGWDSEIKVARHLEGIRL